MLGRLIVLYFVMTYDPVASEPGNGVSVTLKYEDINCNLPDGVIGVNISDLQNPQFITFPDSNTPNLHCSVDITPYLADLKYGEYHVATTVVEPDRPFGSIIPISYNHDPHTSPTFVRGNNIIRRPTNLRIVP